MKRKASDAEAPGLAPAAGGDEARVISDYPRNDGLVRPERLQRWELAEPDHQAAQAQSLEAAVVQHQEAGPYDPLQWWAVGGTSLCPWTGVLLLGTK
ncbi:hypothetical protein GPECTOR_7g1053 [Gonium pectorale]|uniref:Uncharacterized protein n=1 Tax=Gonium pectorale TaxID=33097 RepID=A0A150GTL2_GONPE|nr:hypothetical protein GPECTOR_7g1053 [Gonium pectorale]|eukprot:KXZ53161.1 hypothetical protein GPECTOR_7g1053 [Gonium pectorale]